MGPYKITSVKGNERYEMEKLGIHDGPNKTSSSADNIKKWPTIQRNHQIAKINMIRNVPCNKTTGATIFIEGNIGAGKSTLLNHLAKYNFIKIHQEPVDKWQNFNGFNLLELSYENPEKYASMFQSYALFATTRSM